MKTFEFLDHTGDEGIAVYGSSAEELFQHAAQGFFAILLDEGRIETKETRAIALAGDGYEDLMVRWLSELLYLFETELLIFKEFDIHELDGDHLSAAAKGERFDNTRHTIAREIKAVTYHQLDVKRKDGLWQARIIFDL